MTPGEARSRISRGCVFHAWHEGSGKHKFGVILNGVWPAADDVVLFVLATSQLDFYAMGNLDSQIVRLPAGRYTFFPKETIIDFRRLWPVLLKSLVAADGFSIKGLLEPSDLAQCDRCIRGALQLTGRQKKQLLPPP